MRLNVLFTEDSPIDVGFTQSNRSFNSDFGEVQTRTNSDYNKLSNKPRINNVELIGALSAEELGLGRVLYDTTANWAAQPYFITEPSVIYIFSDAYYLEDEVGNRTPIAGLKIGDGTSSLEDLPFMTDAITTTVIRHITDSGIHATAQEKAFWNNKVSAYIDRENSENLVLSKTKYEINGNIVSHE